MNTSTEPNRWILKLISWAEDRLQSISVRARLLGLSLGLMGVLGCTNLLLGIVVYQREAQESEQMQQYDRLQAITTVRDALANVRNIQGQLNVVKLLADPALQAQLEQRLVNVESELEAALKRAEQFDPGSAAIIRDQRQLSIVGTRQAMAALVAKADNAAELARATFGNLDLIESTLKTAGIRERMRADEISQDQIQRARAAVILSIAIILGAVLLGIMFSLLILRSIVQPLQTTIAVLRQINAGETMVDMPPLTSNEFGDMAQALRQFRDQAERLRHLAYTDELTGLGNRAHFDEALRAAVSDAGRAGTSLALLYVDLDNFSSVNDSLGHGAGDRYLREAAQRLQRFALLEAQTWRYSGDKFTLLLDTQAESESWRSKISAQAELILRGLSEPVLLDGHLLPMSVSIGVALYPADGSNGEQLMSSADAAMYLVKKSGRNGVRYANPSLTANARNDLVLATDIRRGLEQREFEPFYQPIVDVVAGRVVGAEALLRWRHPELGVRTAYEFIATAESSGMVHALGEVCLTQVCEQIARWQQAADPIWISANVSTRQIEDRTVISLLEALRSRFPFNPEGLTLEITESAMLEQVERAQQTLEEVRGMGYRLGVDDFGTGYSSFVYLQRFPVDKIKIDRSFVEKLDSSRAAVAIVAATVALARSLDLDVVAEGVETEAQMRQLVLLGCHLQQGYYYTRALPTAEFESWRQQWVPPIWV
ncbi:MAG: EAL domain-containing protein [Pseudomonadota bacterium]